MLKYIHKGLQSGNRRDTLEQNEREHTQTTSPSRTDENPERITEEEASDHAEANKEEKHICE